MPNKKVERRYFDAKELRITTEKGVAPSLRGISVVFDKLSLDLGGFREKVDRNAFDGVLKQSDCRSLFNHDPSLILGREAAGTLRLNTTPDGLESDVDLPGTTYSDDLAISVGRGDVTQQSFGFTVKRDSWEEDKETGEVIRTILEIGELFDVSPVTFPAYPDTTVAKRSLDGFKKSTDTSGEDSNDTIAKNRLAEDEKREKYFKTKGLIK